MIERKNYATHIIEEYLNKTEKYCQKTEKCSNNNAEILSMIQGNIPLMRTWS